MAKSKLTATTGALLIGSGGLHSQGVVMQALAAEMLAKLPDGTPGRTELAKFKAKLDEAVTLLDEACDELGPEGNPMYRPYTLP